MSFKEGIYRIEELIVGGILEIGDGYRAKNSELSSTGIPFARAGNINGGFKFETADLFPAANLSKVGSKVSQPGDVVFTSKGTVGRFALVGPNTPRFVYSPQLCFWRSLDCNALVPEYLYYWMNSQEFLRQIGYLKGQTDMADYVSLRDQRKITATIPATHVQRGVVDLLSPVDDRIAVLRETNATLEAIAQALFKSWFVDFDPVRAKAEGREPEGIDAATAALFPNSMAQWLQEWRRARVDKLFSDNILTIGDGYRAKNSELGSPGVSFVRAGDLLQGRITPTQDSLSISAFAKAHNKMAIAGDTAFTSKGTIGRFAYVDESAGQAVYSPQVCFWRSLNREQLQPAFLHFWMRSLLFSAQVDKVRGQAAIMDFVSLSDQRRMLLDVPPPALQRRFAECAEPILNQVSSNRATARVLVDLRDTLLPRLISGQLRLHEAEALLKDAA